jgi:hypothetical protein
MFSLNQWIELASTIVISLGAVWLLMKGVHAVLDRLNKRLDQL